jgi:methionyl-tRNA formyltransferase
MDKIKYVIAGSKSWTYQIYENILKNNNADWSYVCYVRDEQELDEIVRSISPRYIFFTHWSQIIPNEIHEAFECVIFHMTDLPYGRGGSPLQNLILRGHQETQISALRCVAKLDAGPIYMKRPLSLEGSASEIFLRAADVVQKMIEEIVRTGPLPKLQKGKPTVFRRRTPEQSNLCEAPISDLNDFFDFIRMLDAPTYPLAFIEQGDFLLEFSDARLLHNSIEARVTIRRKDDLQ